MTDFFMDVGVALPAVPLNTMPLINSTSGNAVVSTLAHNAAGLALHWNFLTSAGAFTRTQVTPAASGDYAMTSQGGGLLTIQMPASGGASINNNLEGVGWFTGVADGVLPWTGPRIGFRAAALNAMFSTGRIVGSLPQFMISDAGIAQAITASTVTLRAAATLEADTIAGSVLYISSSTTGRFQPVIITAYNATTRVAQVSPSFIITPTGTIEYIIFASPRSPTDASVLPNVAVEAINSAAQTTVQSAALAALNSYDPPTHAELTSSTSGLATSAALTTVANYIDTEVAQILAAVDTEITAIKAVTDNLPNGGALTSIINAIAALNNVSVQQILTTQMTESYAANGVAPTLAQAIFAIHQHLMNFVISGTSRTVRRLDGTTTAFVGTLNNATTPTGLSR